MTVPDPPASPDPRAICAACGTRIPIGSPTCPDCGSSVGEMPTERIAVPPVVEGVAPAPVVVTQRSWFQGGAGWAPWAAVAGALLALVVVLALLLGRRSSNDTHVETIATPLASPVAVVVVTVTPVPTATPPAPTPATPTPTPAQPPTPTPTPVTVTVTVTVTVVVTVTPVPTPATPAPAPSPPPAPPPVTGQALVDALATRPVEVTGLPPGLSAPQATREDAGPDQRAGAPIAGRVTLRFTGPDASDSARQDVFDTPEQARAWRERIAPQGQNRPAAVPPGLPTGTACWTLDGTTPAGTCLVTLDTVVVTAAAVSAQRGSPATDADVAQLLQRAGDMVAVAAVYINAVRTTR